MSGSGGHSASLEVVATADSAKHIARGRRFTSLNMGSLVEAESGNNFAGKIYEVITTIRFVIRISWIFLLAGIDKLLELSLKTTNNMYSTVLLGISFILFLLLEKKVLV